MATKILLTAFSVGVKVTTGPALAEDAAIIRCISARRKDGRRGLGEDEELMSATSVSRTPYVLPGETPNTLKDLRVHVIDSV